jgi:hypothetical protein
MIESWVLIEEKNVDKEALRSVSLMNAKHLVVGSVPGSGVILHVAANSTTDLGNALLAFAEVSGVTSVLTLAVRTSQ